MKAGPRPETGSLIVVGTGIRIVGQLTTESVAWMKRADRLLYVVNDPVSSAAIAHLNPRGAESLASCYAEGKSRRETYDEMVERTLATVRSGMLTCLAVYGHPGVFADAAHEAIRRARAEGFAARMLPGISAEDCLFAELGIDPATHGCQSYDATDFLLHSRAIDASSAVVLWQVGVVGDPLSRREGADLWALSMLVDRLCQFYPPDHACTVYHAAIYPGASSFVRTGPIRDLGEPPPPAMSLLYIPPARVPIPDPNVASRIRAMLAAGLPVGSTDRHA